MKERKNRNFKFIETIFHLKIAHKILNLISKNRNMELQRRIPFYFLVFILSCSGCNKQENIFDQELTYQIIQDSLSSIINREIETLGIPSLSLALVSDNETIWAAGFGFEDKKMTIPASGETVYRVGSVSKLFTDLAIMQLKEKGVINLDTNITTYIPEFKPENPYPKPITLRQLMSHRSGLVREPPIGHYFDDQHPDLKQTVMSLNQTKLVYEPEKWVKYSNAGIAVVGYVLEKTQHTSFESYLEQSILLPLGMGNSSFYLKENQKSRLAHATMWTYDGRIFDAPTFDLGMSPAGSMYTTVLDLSEFLKMLFNGGKSANGPIVQAATLDSMWTPQFSNQFQDNGFGIGFALHTKNGRSVVGHGGAIYGFATQLTAMPKEKLGVIVTCAKDGANDLVSKIADYALDALLAVKNGEKMPLWEKGSSVKPTLAKSLEGIYKSGQETIELEEKNGSLISWIGSISSPLSQKGDTLLTDGPLSQGTALIITPDSAISLNGKIFRKTDKILPKPVPIALKNLIGEYGWDHNILFILEKEGQLYALIEWFFLYPLTQISENVFEFPDYGLYHGEKIKFSGDGEGRVTEAVAAGIPFKRRNIAGDGTTFKIIPSKSISELRLIANQAEAPSPAPDALKPELVELTDLDPTIKLDIRYATKNNFMGAIFYEEARAFLQRPAAEALLKVHQQLKLKGLGLLIHDAYRPWYVTKMFYEATPENQKIFVANPYPGSIHNRGAAVDLTLYDLNTGAPIQMVSGYDEFSERAFPNYVGGISLQRHYRELLRDEMEKQGFTVYPYEWWHFNFKDAEKYPVLNQTFKDL